MDKPALAHKADILPTLERALAVPRRLWGAKRFKIRVSTGFGLNRILRGEPSIRLLNGFVHGSWARK